MVEIDLDDRLQLRYGRGEERTLSVEVRLDGETVVDYETNSRPWDEGQVQVRNVIAMNVDEYSREELTTLIEDSVPAHESELRELYE